MTKPTGRLRRLAKVAAATALIGGTLALTQGTAHAAGYVRYGSWPVNQSQYCYYAEAYHPDYPGHPDFCRVEGSRIYLYVWQP